MFNFHLPLKASVPAVHHCPQTQKVSKAKCERFTRGKTTVQTYNTKQETE